MKGKMSRSAQANLVFPVGRQHRYFKSNADTKRYRISMGASVYAAAVLEYMSAEVLELAGNWAKELKKSRITPRHIMLAIHNDDELQRMLGNVTIPNSGVRPFIHPALVPQKRNSANKTIPDRDQATPPPLTINETTTVAASASTSQPQTHSGNVILLERRLQRGQVMVVVRGDICGLKVDAVVNPTNAKFDLYGEIGQSLERAGGDAFKENVRVLAEKQGDLAIGAVATGPSSPGMKSKFVIHIRCPSWNVHHGDTVIGVDHLESAVEAVLVSADKINLKSLALPALGTEISGFPKDIATSAILTSVVAYFDANTQSSIKEIYLTEANNQSHYMNEMRKLIPE